MEAAPVLERLLTQVRGWVGIEVVAHRFGGAEFRIGKAELGHLHACGTLDVHFPVALRNRLIDAGWASAHHVLPCSGWVTFALPHVSEHVEHHDDDHDLAIRGALRLLRVAYLRHRASWAAAPGAIPMLLALCNDVGLAGTDEAEQQERETVSA